MCLIPDQGGYKDRGRLLGRSLQGKFEIQEDKGEDKDLLHCPGDSRAVGSQELKGRGNFFIKRSWEDLRVLK